MRAIEKASGRQAGSAASGIRERKGEGGPPFSLPDPARPPPAFSIVRTDREPGTGYGTRQSCGDLDSTCSFSCDTIRYDFIGSVDSWFSEAIALRCI